MHIFVLPLTAKPLFEKPLKDIELIVGKPIKFEATVTGLPHPETVWKKDGVVVESTDRIKIEARGNSKMLSIKQATTEDVGLYSLEATNEVGEASSSANLNVLGTVPCVKKLPNWNIKFV